VASETPPLSFLRSEGLLLAALPVFGSLTAFAYEVGHLAYFGVPLEFVDIAFHRVVVATLLLCVPVLVTIAVLVPAAIVEFKLKAKRPWLAKWLPMTAAILSTGLAVGWVVADEYMAITVWIALVLASAALALLAFGISRVLRVLMDWAAERAENLGAPIPNYIVKGVQARIVLGLQAAGLMLGCLAAVSVLSAHIGYFVAALSKQHYTLQDEPDMVLVRKYGELFLFAKFDASAHKLTGNHELRRVTPEKPLRLKRMHTGRLYGRWGQ
jgi:hypothetical protein